MSTNKNAIKKNSDNVPTIQVVVDKPKRTWNPLFLTAFIMILSSVSTLDSTFTSTAKLLGPDMNGLWGWLGDLATGKVSPLASARGDAISKYMPMALKDTTDRHVWYGRIGMLFMALVGTLPVLEQPV